MLANLLALLLQCAGYGRTDTPQTSRPWNTPAPQGNSPHRPTASEPGITSSGGEGMTQYVILAPVDERAQIEEALGHLVTTAKLLPAHFIDKRADLHDMMNSLLDQWEACA